MNTASNRTIVYCSSNREKPEFEGRIVAKLLENCGDVPIVSVTQKPMNLGRNICVGDDIGVTGFNYFRQFQIGCMASKTAYIVSAEADCLYPPDYFQFKPTKPNVCYRNSNLYVMPDLRDYFFYKGTGATHAQYVGRDYCLRVLDNLFSRAPKWSKEEKNFPKERWGFEDVFREIEFFRTKNPVFQIKTHDGMRYYTKSERTPILSIPYWGDGEPIRKYFIHGKGHL